MDVIFVAFGTFREVVCAQIRKSLKLGWRWQKNFELVRATFEKIPRRVQYWRGMLLSEAAH